MFKEFDPHIHSFTLSTLLYTLINTKTIKKNSINYRATLLLVPLLGLQYIVTPFKPDPGHPWERLYETVSAFTASFQVILFISLNKTKKNETFFIIKRTETNIYFLFPTTKRVFVLQYFFVFATVK